MGVASRVPDGEQREMYGASSSLGPALDASSDAALLSEPRGELGRGGRDAAGGPGGKAPGGADSAEAGRITSANPAATLVAARAPSPGRGLGRSPSQVSNFKFKFIQI